MREQMLRIGQVIPPAWLPLRPLRAFQSEYACYDSLPHRGPTRHEHAIRSRPEKVVWYASEGSPLLVVPVAPTLAEVGDVYVHKSEGEVQVWLRIDDGTWQPVGERHPHPRLKGHVLRLLDNGDPRWVTKDTFRTYLGRRKKQT